MAHEFLSRTIFLAIRRIRQEPGPAVTVILTLALTIGATTTIFSFVNALLLRPFPFRDADRLVEIHSLRGGQTGKLSMREVLDIQEQVPSLSAVAGHTGSEGGYNFSGEGRPQEWKTVLTTGNLFAVLGVPLAAGHTWPAPADRNRDFNVVLSYEVWQSTFAGRPDILGKKITLDHAPGYTIDGVAARRFDFPRGVQIYRSIGGFAMYDKRDYRNVVGIGRMQPSHTMTQVQAELSRLSGQLASEYPQSNQGLTLEAVSFRDLYSGDVRPYLLLLLGAVALVLMIACGNTANILLSRAVVRSREFAIRTAMGASRLELMGHVLIESTTLACFAAILGILLSYWWVKLLRAMIGSELPDWMTVDLDSRVMLFAVGISLLSGVLSGLAPGFQFSRQTLATALREGGRGSSVSRSAHRVRNTLLVTEIALATMLLAGAGLLIRGFSNLQSQAKGFDTDRISTFRVALGWKRYLTPELEARYYERALEKLGVAFGHNNVALISNPPLTQQEQSSLDTAQAEGQSLEEARLNPYVNRQCISETYFSLSHIPLKAGRFFEPFDRPISEPVALVSERLAKRLWPKQNPLGKRLRYSPFAKTPEPFRKVVGIVGSVQHDQLGGERSLDFYVPYRQASEANQYVLVRTPAHLRQFQSKAEQLLWSIDPEQSVFDFKTYDTRILENIWQLRLSRLIFILFGVVALVIAAVGIYGMMSYLVGQRTREMGVRLALGGSPQHIRWLLLLRSFSLTLAGLSIGLGSAVLFGAFLRHSLQHVPQFDLLSFLFSGIALLFVGLFAAAAPAWRASHIDPAIALRDE